MSKLLNATSILHQIKLVEDNPPGEGPMGGTIEIARFNLSDRGFPDYMVIRVRKTIIEHGCGYEAEVKVNGGSVWEERRDVKTAIHAALCKQGCEGLGFITRGWKDTTRFVWKRYVSRYASGDDILVDEVGICPDFRPDFEHVVCVGPLKEFVKKVKYPWVSGMEPMVLS